MTTRAFRTPTALLTAALLLGAAPAWAHDELSSTEPADGTSLTAPEEVTLSFTGEIAEVGAAVEVTGAGGTVTEGAPEVQGTMVVQPLQDDLEPGAYEVTWRVTSEDGHPISGTFGFEVEGSEKGAEEDTEEEDTPAPAPAPSTEAAAEQPSATPTESTDSTSPQEVEADAQDTAPDGIPGWAWVLLGLGVVGLLALLGTSVSRNRR